jgi:fused signal recognition particle receptor
MERVDRKAAFGQIATILGATEIKDDIWDDLEALLIQADLGVETTIAILDQLETRVDQEGITRTAELRKVLREELLNRLDAPPPLDFSAQPTVVLIVGVNGSGKTTTIAKLGKRFTQQGKSVLQTQPILFAQLQTSSTWANGDLGHFRSAGRFCRGNLDTVRSAGKSDLVLIIQPEAARFNLMEG